MKRFVQTLLLTGAALLGSAVALPAAAQFAKPEDAIKYRKAAFTVMAAHFGRVAGMANGRIPFDAKVAAENAEIANVMAKLPYAGFGPGTDKGDTKAEPKIWTEMDKFNAAASKMQEEMGKLNVAAKGGNLDAIKAAVGETGKSCKACHDNYRKE
ncbi:MAG TPA: cytochrome c [Burkholderiaceae bacterium]